MSAVQPKDPYGYARALDAYQTVYQGLTREYDATYARLDEQCNQTDAMKGSWKRSANIYTVEVISKMEPSQKTEQIEAIRSTFQGFVKAQGDALALATKLHKGVRLLTERPIPVLSDQTDTGDLSANLADLTQKARAVDNIYQTLTTRIPLAKYEADRCIDWLQNGTSWRVGAYLSHWVWGSTNLDAPVAEEVALQVVKNPEEDQKTQDAVPPLGLPSTNAPVARPDTPVSSAQGSSSSARRRAQPPLTGYSAALTGKKTTRPPMSQSAVQGSN